MIQVILAPTDFSEGSSSATNYAVRMAAMVDAKLILLHVGADPSEHHPTAGAAADIYRLAREEQARYARTAMDRLVAELHANQPEVTIEIEYQSGTPHVAILDASDRLAVDLIVMGTAGLTGVSRFLIGSTAERVVRVSKIPVLTVRR
jgi:nucleotide-binding universal stress UspA family protein